MVDLPDFLVQELLVWLRKQRLKSGQGARIDYLFIDAQPSRGRWPYSQRKFQSLVKRAWLQALLYQDHEFYHPDSASHPSRPKAC